MKPYLLDQGVTDLDDATHLRAVPAAVCGRGRRGAQAVMISYSSTRDGGKIHGDRQWITGVLKDDLGFTGLVVSDWGAVDQIDPDDYRASVVAAIDAGVDMVMVPMTRAVPVGAPGIGGER